MPTGIIINSLSILIGGILGTVMGHKLSPGFKTNINMIFACCSMGMGVSTIGMMENMPAVIFSIIIGTMIGLGFHLGDRINTAAGSMQKLAAVFIRTENTGVSQQEFMDTFVTVLVLFCASGTGIYGSILSGMTGDHSILISKSILDLFTALIFACTLGIAVSAIAIPQFIIFTVLFLCAGLIFPLTTPSMINDFKACGGFIMLATGFRIMKVKMFPVADMVPSMILVMPFSWLWMNYILPFVS
ncbi:MAG: DUF554 domain-containing protein [Blautia sp.]